MSKISSDIRSVTPLILKPFLDVSDEYISEFEKAIYKNPDTYYYQVALLKTVLDPESKLAEILDKNLFLHNKIKQQVYTPERLATLTISDALPEIFLNNKINDKIKADLLNNLNHYLESKTKEMITNYQAILNPTFSIPTISFAVPVALNKDLIKSSSLTNIRKLCVNPYWGTSEVDTIICKDNGKFYCLDTLDLLKQIASGETPVNPFTKNDIDEEIVSNLIKRYGSKIQDIKKGKTVSLNHYRTDKEIKDLDELEGLFLKAQNLLDDTNLMDMVQLFGVSTLFDTEPDLERILTETSIKELDEKEDEDRIKALKSWIESNLEKIGKAKKETTVSLSEEYEIETIPKIEEKELEEGEIAPEEVVLEKNVLKPGSLIMSIYNSKINKLKVLQQSAIKDLNKADYEGKKEMSEILKKIVETQKMMPDYLKSLNGIVTLLNNELEHSVRVLEIKKMALKKASPLSQKALLGDLETYITDIKNEITYLTVPGGKQGTV